MKSTSILLTTVLAFGVGVGGTLLWAGTRPRPTTQTVPPRMPASSIPDISAAPLPNGIRLPDGTRNLTANAENSPSDSQSGQHTPPASLTSGMSPAKTAKILGDWYYDHEQWPLAIKNYRTAIKGGADNPNIRTDLGNALRFYGRPQEALKQYQIAQQQKPAHEQSLFNQGTLYASDLKDPRKAIEICEIYLERFPKGSAVAQARELIVQSNNQL